MAAGLLGVLIAAFVLAAIVILLLWAIAGELGKIRGELEALRAEFHDAREPRA